MIWKKASALCLSLGFAASCLSGVSAAADGTRTAESLLQTYGSLREIIQTGEYRDVQERQFYYSLRPMTVQTDLADMREKCFADQTARTRQTGAKRRLLPLGYQPDTGEIAELEDIVEEDGLFYAFFANGEAALAGYDLPVLLQRGGQELVIPQEVCGRPVTEIGSRALYGIRLNDDGDSVDALQALGLRSVTLPDTVRLIGDEAFCGCLYADPAELTGGEARPLTPDDFSDYHINLPAQIRFIGAHAFDALAAEALLPDRHSRILPLPGTLEYLGSRLDADHYGADAPYFSEFGTVRLRTAGQPIYYASGAFPGALNQCSPAEVLNRLFVLEDPACGDAVTDCDLLSGHAGTASGAPSPYTEAAFLDEAAGLLDFIFSDAPDSAFRSLLDTRLSDAAAQMQFRAAAPAAGDLNGDGSVSIADAVLLVRWLAEEHDSIIAGDRLRMADLNGDGVLTALDSTLLMRMLL